MSDITLGLDIGTSSIKAVQLARGLKGFKVASCVLIPMDRDPGHGFDETLRALGEKISFSGADCNASIYADRVAFRNLTMPFKDKKKIAQTINYELEPMLPFSIDDIATDYIAGDQSKEETSVLSASTQREGLQQFLASLSLCGLDPDVVDVNGVPTAMQVAMLDGGTSNTLLIDIGSKASTIILLVGRRVVLARCLHFGGDSMTRAIAEAQNVTAQEAELLKCDETASGLAKAVSASLEPFCREIRNTLHAFRSEVMPEAYPEKALLTGGAALFEGLDDIMAQFLDFPVAPIDLAQSLDLEFDQDASHSWNPLLMNGALALALRDAKNKGGFNFRIGNFSKANRYEQLKGETKRIAIYAAAILMALAASFFADYYVLKKQHDHLQGQIVSIFKGAFPEVKRIVDPVHQMKTRIKQAKESTLLPDESLVARTCVDVLRDIALRVPKAASIDLSSLVIDEERIRIKGLTDTFNTVDEIKNGLQTSGYLKDVSIASAQLDRKTNKIRFELVMTHP